MSKPEPSDETLQNFLRQHVLWELDSISFTRAPLLVAEETRTFVNAMLNTTSSDGKLLLQFLFSLPLYSFRDGAIRMLLNEQVSALLVQHEELAIQKEDAVVNYQFELAARKRDQQYEIIDELNHMFPEPIAILPEHLIALIRELGFDGPLCV